ncbi:hypothetical protein EUGRSUZ_J00474 [Eucalyptus grandis]|uniref:Uncharacterized protein n=2 Tax=Eucalyptus grandis TaxID=71139 RepID=A0ACC3J1Y7_EUCGR|nr:hypothetical protein EUGRSUZ_J00474 [Eucalyptus grandis]
MTSDKFLKMMLLDCCFVLELLRDPKSDGAPDEGNPIATEPWIRPIVTRDLLKLGNQVPFFILKGLSCMSLGRKDEPDDNLRASALEFLSRVYPRSPEAKTDSKEELHHLLHLYYSTLIPENQSEPENKTGKFLDISFRKRVLEIPSITINDFMANMLIQCLALEQRWDNDSKHITDYVFFMYCLINQPEDASLLCSNGIIAKSSHNDQYLDELKTYYNNNWAYILRTYFSSPWSIIAVFSAFLGIALTVIQTVYTVLGHHSH